MFTRSILVASLLFGITQIVPTPSYATSAYHRIRINFAFNSSAYPDKQLKGYNLYAAGKLICEKPASTEIKPIDCTVKLVDGTYPFTLAVAFKDGTSTAQSAPFKFALNDKTALPRIDAIISRLLLLKGDRN